MLQSVQGKSCCFTGEMVGFCWAASLFMLVTQRNPWESQCAPCLSHIVSCGAGEPWKSLLCGLLVREKQATLGDAECRCRRWL